MTSTTRATQILNSYGANPLFWPENERPALLQEIRQNPELFSLQQQAKQLDEQLFNINDYSKALISSVETERLANHIMAKINQQTTPKQAKKVSWLRSFLQTISHINQPQMIAASALLLFATIGVLQFNSTNLNEHPSAIMQTNLDSEIWLMEQLLASPDDDYFADSELYVQVDDKLLDDDLESEFL